MRTIIAATVALALASTTAIGSAAQDAPAPSTSTELLPGVTITVEEVEPGVVRVLSDGVREFSWPVEPGETRYFDPLTSPPGAGYWGAIQRVANLVANDEGVWLGGPDGIVRLGDEGFVWEAKSDWHALWLEVAADGTLHMPERMTFLGKNGWKKVTMPSRRAIRFPSPHGVTSILFAPDGSLWVEGLTGKTDKSERARLARRDDNGWFVVKLPLPLPNLRSWPGIEELQATDDGVLYVRRGSRFLQRYDGRRWDTLPRPAAFKGLYVAPEGTVWAVADGPERERRLYRLDADGKGWTAHEVDLTPHPLLDVGWSSVRHSSAAAPDGAFWFAAGDGDREDGRCDGITR